MLSAYQQMQMFIFSVLLEEEDMSPDDEEMIMFASVIACLILHIADAPPSNYIQPEVTGNSFLSFHSSRWNGEKGERTFKSNFRFRRIQFAHLSVALGLADQVGGDLQFRVFRTQSKMKAQWDFLLLLVLYRLATPSVYRSCVDLFGRSNTALSSFFREAIDYLYTRFAAKGVDPFIWTDCFMRFIELFSAWDVPVRNVIGVIDGNFIQICRPGGLGNVHARYPQEHYYSGKEKKHGIKFLAMALANGMLGVSGAYRGSMHDSKMMEKAGWENKLRDVQISTGVQMVMFGDAGFATSPHLITMYRGFIPLPGLTFNAFMSRVRILVENQFASLKQTFRTLGDVQHMKLGNGHIDREYIVAVFLFNCFSIFNGNQVTKALKVHSNNLEGYIARCK